MKGKKYIIFILIIILPCILIALIGSIRSPKETPTETTETNSQQDSASGEIMDTTTTETILPKSISGVITYINPEDPYSSQMGYPLQITKMETSTITGVITEISSGYTGFMFAETADADYWRGTMVYVKDNTVILINDNPASLRDLSVGDSISIEFTGEIAESSPAQLHHPLIIKLIEE